MNYKRGSLVSVGGNSFVCSDVTFQLYEDNKLTSLVGVVATATPCLVVATSQNQATVKLLLSTGVVGWTYAYFVRGVLA